ncbi:hypothetical protein FRC04_009524 [Tulasnella sp. 424]|nr:hypothetical protein FRC04_009524 [Tulasnella sp. 424]
MDPSTKNKENKIIHRLREFPGKWTIKMRGEFVDDEERRRYRETLRRRRTRVICFKLLANALYLFAWSYVNLSDHTQAFTYDTFLELTDLVSVVLIVRQTTFLVPLTDVSEPYYDNPYITASAVLYGLTVAGLAVDLLLSLFWSGFLGATAKFNKIKYPRIWVSHAQDFPWLSDKRSTSDTPQPH